MPRTGDPPYRIRLAEPQDAAALAAVEAAAFDSARYGGMIMTAAAFRRHAGSRNIFLVAQGKGRRAPPIGYALGLVRRGSPYVRFYSFAVAPKYQGTGAGGMLFAAMERSARRAGYRGLRLEVREDNTRLRDRYGRAGYRVFETVPQYYPDGAAAIRMVRVFG